MAETAGDVIRSALGELLVRASEAPLEADETQDAIKYLNRMMSALAVTGVTLGYTAVSSLADEMTVPDGAIEGIVKNLAVQLLPQFGTSDAPDTAVLLAAARDSQNTLLTLAIDGVGPTQFPGTLPIGSGNEDTDAFGVDHFYSEADDPVLIEQGAFISVETDTELP